MNLIDLLLYFFNLISAAQAVIVGHPRSMAVVPGRPAVFECRVEKRSGQVLTATWLHCKDDGKKPCEDENMVDLRLGSDIIMSHDNSLVLLNVQASNAGKYGCKIRDDNSYLLSNVARLDVLGKPTGGASFKLCPNIVV